MKLKFIIAFFILSLLCTTTGALMKVNSMSEGNMLLSCGMVTGAVALIMAFIKVLSNKDESSIFNK
jgi:hypothetical protein